MAQTVSPDVDNKAPTSGVEEIVVTAQKRAQNLQDVPLAVTAISQETLQVNRVQSVNDLTGLAPGLLSRQNAGAVGSPSFSMRGVYATGSAAAQDRQISVYLDGVYVGGARGSVFDLPDLERIEVLRGPQGTLFGRNATAGAISVVTRDPTGVFKARQEVTVGNYDQFRTRTTIDTPQFGAFSAYVTYVHDERRGDVRNLGAGTLFDRTSPFSDYGAKRSPKWLGGRNFENFFAAVRFAPTDNFSMTYKYDRSDGDYSPEARTTAAINPNSVTGALLVGVIAAQPVGGGRFGPVPLNPSDKRPKATNNAWDQEGFAKSYGHNLTTAFEVSDHVSLKNISSYRYSTAFGPSTLAGLSGLEFTDAARTPYGRFVAVSSLGAAFFAQTPAQQAATVATFANNFTSQVGSYFAGYEGNTYGLNKQYSSETQLNYQSELLTATAGALYYHSNILNSGLPGMRPNFAFAPVPSLLPLGTLQDADAKTTSIAAYLQGEVHITPQLDVVAGGRITKDKKYGAQVIGGTYVGTPAGSRTNGTITGTTTFPFAFKKTKPSFSIGANYKPNDDILLYGKYSTAFLSGGAVGQISFQPETVKSEELGIKSEFLDRRLRVNLALYHAVYDHSQASVSGSVVTVNGVAQTALGIVVIDNGTLKSKGAELEITAAPADGLTFGGSVGYTDADLTSPSPLLAPGGRATYKQPGVAKWIGSSYAQYQTQPLFDDAFLNFRLDANYQGKYRNIANPTIKTTIPAFAPYEFAASRWILNSRVALREIKVGSADAEVALWARNLTNNRDTATAVIFGDFQVDSSFQPARTYGVDLIVNFK